MGKAIDGTTIHNTVEMHHMVTEEPRTSSVVKVPGEPVIEGELAVVVVPGVPVGLVAPEDPVAREVRAALAAQEDLAVPAALAV